MGYPVSYADALVVESLGQAVRAAAFLVPGAVGVQEVGFIAVCAVYGIPAGRGAGAIAGETGSGDRAGPALSVRLARARGESDDPARVRSRHRPRRGQKRISQGSSSITEWIDPAFPVRVIALARRRLRSPERSDLHRVMGRNRDMLHRAGVAIAVDHAACAAVAHELALVEVVDRAQRLFPEVAAPEL